MRTTEKEREASRVPMKKKRSNESGWNNDVPFEVFFSSFFFSVEFAVTDLPSR